MNEEDYEWISASEYAARFGVSKQTVYNKIKSEELVARPFKRGLYNGYIVRVKK